MAFDSLRAGVLPGIAVDCFPKTACMEAGIDTASYSRIPVTVPAAKNLDITDTLRIKGVRPEA